MSDDDKLIFAGEEAQNWIEQTPWKILIVDDEPTIHEVTKLALGNVQFRGRRLEFHHAYSGRQALEMFQAIPDLAVIFLDVVMETDDAGLRLVRTLRQDLDEIAVRIILRTGQPGIAPERSVIADYDINDYKQKTELTADRLFAVTIAALRGYDDLKTIEQLRRAAFETLSNDAHLSRQILDFLGQGFLYTDPLLVVLGATKSAADMLGLDTAEIVGRPLPDLLPSALIEQIGPPGAPDFHFIWQSPARTAPYHLVARSIEASESQAFGGFLLGLEREE